MSIITSTTTDRIHGAAPLWRLLPMVQALTGRIQLKGVPRLLWMTRHLFTRPDATYRVYRDVRLKIDHDTLYQWWNVINYGGYETILLLERLLRPGDLYVDVGANIGFMAINAARIVGSQGRVLAVEPEPRVREKLCHNVALNRADNIDVVIEAIGVQEGIANFCVATEEGLSRLDHGRGENPCMVRLETIQVPVTTLDRLIERTVSHRSVRLVKIDVEGFEYAILCGARNLLLRRETILIFENNAGALAQNGVSLVEIFELLKAANYDLYSINSHSSDWLRLGRFPSLKLMIDPELDASRAIDVLAIPRGLRDGLPLLLET